MKKVEVIYSNPKYSENTLKSDVSTKSVPLKATTPVATSTSSIDNSKTSRKRKLEASFEKGGDPTNKSSLFEFTDDNSSDVEKGRETHIDGKR